MALALGVCGRVGRVNCAPHDLEDAERVVEGELALALDEEPAVCEAEFVGGQLAEVEPEGGVVAGEHGGEEGDLGGDLLGEGVEVGEAALHERLEAEEGEGLVSECEEQGREQVAHA